MHDINIYLDPNDKKTYLALQGLDESLKAASTPDAPGVIFAQVFPKIASGGVLGVNLKAIVLDHETGLKIKACLCEARRHALLNQEPCNA